jgi:hypothetical protein
MILIYPGNFSNSEIFIEEKIINRVLVIIYIQQKYIPLLSIAIVNMPAILSVYNFIKGENFHQ